MKAFDPVVALGFVDGDEPRLHATEQAQMDDLAQNAGVRMSAAERASVVELVQPRQSQFRVWQRLGFTLCS